MVFVVIEGKAGVPWAEMGVYRTAITTELFAGGFHVLEDGEPERNQALGGNMDAREAKLAFDEEIGSIGG